MYIDFIQIVSFFCFIRFDHVAPDYELMMWIYPQPQARNIKWHLPDVKHRTHPPTQQEPKSSSSKNQPNSIACVKIVTTRQSIFQRWHRVIFGVTTRKESIPLVSTILPFLFDHGSSIIINRLYFMLLSFGGCLGDSTLDWQSAPLAFSSCEQNYI